MIPPIPIETDPLLFDKLLQSLERVLQQLIPEPLSQTAEKLQFRFFVRILFFRLFARIKEARQLDLLVGALSTLHNAFIRYLLAWFVHLSYTWCRRYHR